jgi:hypothetical protein
MPLSPIDDTTQGSDGVSSLARGWIARCKGVTSTRLLGCHTRSVWPLCLLLCALGACAAKQARPETVVASEPSAQQSMPCNLDAFRWRVLNPAGCSASEWLVTPQGDGVYTVQEHGCENLSGTAEVVNGDVQINCAGASFKVHYDLQTSTGQCETISGIYEHQPGGEHTGSGPFEFVKLGPR